MKKLMRFFALFALLATANVQAASNQQMVIGSQQEFDSLNLVLTSMSQSSYLISMLQRDLVTVDANWKWVPQLATKIPTFENGLAQKIIDKDGTEKIIATWEINAKATWGDGTPVTGEDFKLAWQVGSCNNVAVPYRESYVRIQAVTVDKANPKRFSVKYDKADFDYFQVAPFGFLPKHIEGAIFERTKNEMGAYEKQTSYITTPTNPGLYFGPYVVQDYKPGSHIVMIPNAHFYGNTPKIQKIIFKVISNTQALEANLRAGSLDMIGEIGINFDQAMAIEKRAQPTDPFILQMRPSATYEHIRLNMSNSLLSDVRVRRGLLYAIDRDKLTKSLFDNRQTKAMHFVHPDDPYFTDKVTQYPYDLAKANQLFDEAGWKKGADGYRTKDGQKLSFTIMSTADNKTRDLVEVYLQDQWKQAGVELKIKNEPARVFFGDTLQKMKYPHMAMFADVSAPDMPPKFMVLSKAIPTAANGYSGQNYSAWNDPKLDATIPKVLGAFALPERAGLMHEIISAYTSDVPALPLYYRADIAVVPKNLKGFQITGHQFYSSQNVEDWDLGQ